MINDGNGTCHDKTTYLSFISQHEDKYVLQVKEGGSAPNATQIGDCAYIPGDLHSQPTKFQELKNSGGYGVRSAGLKCGASTIIVSYSLMISMFINLCLV